MNRRQFAAGLAANALAQAPRRPNVLVLMPDQWRGQDLGSMGNEQIRTPVLDKLASEGTQFTNAAANCPVCTPARACLMTGKYPHQVRMAVNDVPLGIQEVTIAELLKLRGYYTGFIGKWHLHGGRRDPGFVPPGPWRQGFDFWAANICNHQYLKTWYFRDDPTPIPIEGYEVFAWTDLAIEFLQSAKQRSQPFYLNVWYGPPHDPYLTPKGFEGLYQADKLKMRPNWRAGARRFGTPKDIEGYYAAITCLDSEIGRLLVRLRELDLEKDTIVYFLSDHGDMLGSQGTFLKRKPWEESAIVPSIFRWPGRIPSGRRSDALFSHIDVVPTLLGFCGVEKPASMPGQDLSGYLLGKDAKAPDEAHLMIYTATEMDEWAPWRGLRTRQWKYARHEDRPWVLYDLEKDPYETNNLAAERSSRTLIAEFDRRIALHMAETGDEWTRRYDRPFR
jgi:arylsulfatase A-like enzyme